MQEGYSKNSVVSNIGDDVEIQKLITETVEFYNIDTKTAVFSPIISTYETKVDTLIKFRTDLSKDFISAEDSLFYVENKSSFVRAADLELGDKLVCPTGDSIEYILSIHPCTPVDDCPGILPRPAPCKEPREAASSVMPASGEFGAS